MNSQKGYSVPLILIFVFSLVSIPVYYFFINQQAAETVKGANTKATTEPGFGVQISSKSGTWDLVEYLCKDYDSCVSNLTAGTRMGLVSGGVSDLHEVVVSAQDDWSNYSYIKFYVRPSWHSDPINYRVVSLGSIPFSKAVEISDGTRNVEVVVAPLENISSTYIQSAHFSDSN
ncbi:hypothetical protein H6802_01300 [Candidatus Nomurabacteria bacterium]|uniref:Uncharacterized protein n=1 Tax=candidate division WWE3 bacterium TaxID=2053526 RepID=A0A955E1P0_UNCKA|nr:hypothetical protein [candidate division WWE3 bacterium]MCB9823577.1 hypothetical protein [Candidatus Nomurabacteria bacterium]MCB9827372.1 hypothetical protein [Candidatus Nomurabacteria bacterium]HXK52674.1 hypothetical protein [bacterium]